MSRIYVKLPAADAAGSPKIGEDKMKENRRIKEVNEERKQYEIAIIGAGGIGSHLLGSLIPALHRGSLWTSLDIRVRIYDSDIVSIENTSHQRFCEDQVGNHKVDAIFSSMSPYLGEHLQITPCPWDVRETSDMTPADMTVVAVDSDEARKAVHSNGGLWLDLRCKGDGYIAIDFRVAKSEVLELTPSQPPTSCQLEGAISTGNIQFGHLFAAAHGAQWILQCMRNLEEDGHAIPPIPQIANISYGTLSRIEMPLTPTESEKLEENPPTSPIFHELQDVFADIDYGEHDSERVFEMIAYLALGKEWPFLWAISHRMNREISALIDSESRVFVDIGEPGEVRLAPPSGATIPFRTWIHTHPMEAYWSETDRETLAICSEILDEAFVLGNDHFMHTYFSKTHQCQSLGPGMLENWTSEPKQYYSHLP